MDIIVGGMSIPGADGIFSWQKPDSPRARPAVFLAPMLFGLKKFISFWLMPLPFCLTLIVVGACLLRFSRRPALGRRLLLAGVLLLMLPVLLSRLASLGGGALFPLAMVLGIAGGLIEYVAWTVGFGAMALTRVRRRGQSGVDVPPVPTA